MNYWHKNLKFLVLSILLVVSLPLRAGEYSSPYFPDRVFTGLGFEDFADYIDRLEGGQVNFSLRISGETAPQKYGYSKDFGAYYDELLFMAKQTIDANGSVHISEAIQWGREILSGRTGYFLVDGRVDPKFRKFTEGGKQEFENYISDLEGGDASFSLRHSGLKAAHRLGYGAEFVAFYDELYDLSKAEVAKRGSVHISSVIKFAKNIVASEFFDSDDLAISELPLDAPSKEWFREECELLSHVPGSKQFDDCIQELVEFYVE